MPRPPRPAALVSFAVLGPAIAPALAQPENLHFTYLWHLEQPIYWPDQQQSGPDRYERAWESIQRKDAGAAHPADNLRDIFGLADRVNAYQFRVRDCIDAIDWAPEAGAQVSFSGGLIENLFSLGGANQLGYSPTWYAPKRQARSWTTSGQAKPRLDIVLFSFHHALLPLLDEAVVRKEIQLYKEIYPDAWGTSPGLSRGFFPSEMAFSTRLIPILASEGITWSFVSAEKISRACADFPVVFGSGGVNCDPPNRADQVNPAQGNYYRVTISRGCAPAEAVPLAFQPQRAQYVDPATGAVSSIIVVPCSQSLGWMDGYAPLGLSHFNALNQSNPASRPLLCVLAHDGDNAWGGGYSYYMEATPNLVSQAVTAGYVPTVVEEYLADHPVPAGALVHVEDGAWVNADGDFGAPQFINWNWPLVNAQGQIDVAAGWHEDPRNWAVITAATNRVLTAERVHTAGGGAVSNRRILYPDASANRVERAWHYLLGSLNSGFMYYGTALDHEVKQTVACNEAVQHADIVLAAPHTDATPPTVWIPQRHPWNPGATNFGPQFGYQQTPHNGDFWIWTFAYDTSGIASVTLRYRLDADGANPLTSTQNETYAGGPEVGPWQSVPMTFRDFPAANIYGFPGIDFFESPQYIADQYHAQLTGIRSALVDYYIEAVDTQGNVRSTPIQHVWVGAGSGGGGGGGGGGGDRVTLSPAAPVAGQSVTVAYNPVGGPLAGAPQVYLHWGINAWNPVFSPDPAMTWSPADARWTVTLTLPADAAQFDLVFNNGAGTWDNNSGQDWHFPVSGAAPNPQWVMDGVRDADSTLIDTRNGVSLWAGLKGSPPMLYLAATDAGEGNDHFILLAGPDGPGAPRAAPWAKSGLVAAWSAFLADENNNDFEGWFDLAQGVAAAAATGPNGGVLEGRINLAQQLGTLPAAVHVALAPYATADAGALVSAQQLPAPVGAPNANIEAAEYIRVDLCRFRPGGCCRVDWDRNGAVNSSDVSAFINDWFTDQAAGTLVADFDASGVSNSTDVSEMINAWFAAAAGKSPECP